MSIPIFMLITRAKVLIHTLVNFVAIGRKIKLDTDLFQSSQVIIIGQKSQRQTHLLLVISVIFNLLWQKISKEK